MSDRSQKKREKFVRLAEKRVSNAIKDLRLVGNLANKSHYEYTDEQVRKIISAISKELESVKSKFKETTSEEDAPLFKL